MSGTGADACETRIMLLILGRLMVLEEQLREVGYERPFHVWRANAGAARDRTGRKIEFGEPGQSDLMLVGAGRFMGIETKSAKGVLSPEQKTWRDKIVAGGGLYIVPRDLESAIDPVLELLGLTGRVRWARDHWELLAGGGSV